MRKLVRYYDHTREWWGQAIWFYNKMNKASVPEDLFEQAEQSGISGSIPKENDLYAEIILGYWEENHRLAELVLPEQ